MGKTKPRPPPTEPNALGYLRPRAAYDVLRCQAQGCQPASSGPTLLREAQGPVKAAGELRSAFPAAPRSDAHGTSTVASRS
jgi:hypothetical protein